MIPELVPKFYSSVARIRIKTTLPLSIIKCEIQKRRMSHFLAEERRRVTKADFTQVTPVCSCFYSLLKYNLLVAMRQTWEEIGLDLAERHYMCIGQLDDREITTSLGKRLLMILSPFVFLQLTPHDLPTDPVPSTSLHWTPLASLVSTSSPPKWSTVTVDAASRLAPKHSTALRLLVRVLVGSMQFPAIIVEPTPDLKPTLVPGDKKRISTPTPANQPQQNLKLWGLSLGMALDLMSYMVAPATSSNLKSDPNSSSPIAPIMQLPYQSGGDMRVDIVAPSLASVFPRFSYPDVNFWIWSVFQLNAFDIHLLIIEQGLWETLSRGRSRMGSQR